MATSQKQIMQAKEMFLKQTNKKFLIFFLFLWIILCEQVFAKDLILTKALLNDYIKKTNEFSAQFIQTTSESLSHGFLYLDNKRIKIEYISPSKITIILTQSKAMYFNHDLEEVEYFNPSKTIGNIFYQIFYDSEFFKETKLTSKAKSITAIKNIRMDEEETILSIYFEQNPLILRKIKIKKNNESIVFSMADPRNN